MHLAQDLRYGWRGLARRPGFTAFAVLALALGIGANVAIFSLINALLLRPPAATSPERLVNVHAVSRDGSGFHAFSYLDALDYRDGNPAFSELAAWSLVMLSLSSGDEARVAAGQIVSENYFEVFGIRPAVGRFFAPEEGEGWGRHPVAVIGHALWQRLGGDGPVIGRTLHVNNQPLTIVGVAPEDFSGTFGGIVTDVWVPWTMQPLVRPGVEVENRGFVWLEMVGRLAPGVSRSEASALLDTRYRQLAAAQGVEEPRGGIELGEIGTVPGQIRGGVRVFLAILMAVVGLLLVITCVNVAGMLIVRASERRREIAVRLALGAGRGTLVRQLVTESLLLFTLGGAAGVLLAAFAARLFLAFELPVPVPVALDLGVDGRVLGFSLVLTLLTGLVFGLLPALQATRRDLVPSLSEGRLSGGRRLKLRSALLVGQIAVACLLLVATGLFLRSLERAAEVDPGFDVDGVHLATLDLSLHGYSDEAGAAFLRELRERVAALPEVESVSYADIVPLGFGNSTTGFNVPGHDPPPDDTSHPSDFNTVDVDYFRTMRIPLLAGREFLASDRLGSPRVAVVNATLADRFWPGENPLGKMLVLGSREDAPRVEIVGVARNGKYRTLGEAPRFYLYLPLAQWYEPGVTLHVRARNGLPVASAVRAEIRGLDRHLPIAGEMPLVEHLGLSLLPQRVASAVSAVLGAIALLLVGVGVYGVTAFAVSQRTRELGLRMALGALPRNVLALIMRQGAVLALFGGALGLGAAALATRGLRSVLYGVSATDPPVFLAAATVLGGIVLLGCFFPARRAAALDPLRALRYE